MTLLALAAPTVNLLDPTFSKTATNVPPTTGSALSGNTGFTVPWVSGLAIQIYVGGTSCGVCTLVSPNTTYYASLTWSPATSANMLYGPVSEFWANAGLVQVNVTTATTVIVNAYLLPGYTGTSHNPFEVNVQKVDF